MNAKHTPLPWIAKSWDEYNQGNDPRYREQIKVVGTKGEHVAYCDKPEMDGRAINEANAALIVRAVNSIDTVTAQRDALLDHVQTLLSIFREIDRLTCNCPCMSLQAQHEFERCKEAESYKIALAGVVIDIRTQARGAIALCEKEGKK